MADPVWEDLTASNKLWHNTTYLSLEKVIPFLGLEKRLKKGWKYINKFLECQDLDVDHQFLPFCGRHRTNISLSAFLALLFGGGIQTNQLKDITILEAPPGLKQPWLLLKWKMSCVTFSRGATRMARAGIRLVHGLTKSTLITYYSGMKKRP